MIYLAAIVSRLPGIAGWFIRQPLTARAAHALPAIDVLMTYGQYLMKEEGMGD